MPKMNSFHAIHKLISAYRNGCSLALLFDYEGTLVPIDSTPGTIGWSTRSLLVRLAQLPRTTTGVIGDCALEQLKQAVGVEGIYYAGGRGLEVDLADGAVWFAETHELIAELPRLRKFVEQLLERFPDVLVRQHQSGLIIDFRSAAEGEAELVKAEVLRVFSTSQPELHIYQDAQCMEIAIAPANSKVMAIRLMLERNASAPLVLYAGNDRADAEAFETVNANGGISLGVGANPPGQARYRVRDTAAVNVVLGCLLSAIAAPH